MPFYDYICSTCGHQLEVMHSVHGSGPEACPKCGGVMKKAMVAPAVHFKGSGWARKEGSGGSKTDRTAKPSTAERAETPKSESSSGGDSSGDSGGDSSAAPASTPTP